MSEPSTEPEIVTLTPMPVALLRETVPMNALPEFFGRAYQAVAEALGKQGIAIAGPPVGVYYGMPTDTVDVAAGFPCDRPAVSADGVTAETLPGGSAAQIMHVGSYDSMHRTYERLMAWLGEQGLTGGTVMWETYLTEPTPEGNQDAMLTQITWPLAE